jgi:hypothetical protein
MVQTLQNMMNGSIEVLTRPSVATFEKHERDDLKNALIYIAIGVVISGVFSFISFFTNKPQVPEIAGMENMQPSLIGTVFGGLLGTLIYFLLYTGIIYGLGKAFGGTGKFGELTYDMSLFSVPITIVTSILGIIPVIGGILSFVVSLYSFFLAYLGIQAGMNLPKDKALYVILILVVVGVVFALCTGFLLGGLALVGSATSS